MIVRSSVLAAAAVAALALNLATVAPALAQSAPSIAVSYQDLNLSGAAGRDVLDRRIANAAEQLCGEASTVELTWNAAVQACQAETIAQTQAQRDAAVRYGTVQVIAQADPVVRVSRAAN